MDLKQRTKLASKKRVKYDDPGHGWMKVSIKDLELLGILDKITGFSYQRGENVYLEEDADVSTFFNAVAGEDDPDGLCEVLRNNTTVKHTNNTSRIRGYSKYEFVSPEEKPELEKVRAAVLEERNWNAAGIKTIKNAGKSDLLYWKELYNL